MAQLYVADPAAAGEPPHQLKGFQRITLNPGASGDRDLHRHRARPGLLGHHSSNWIAGAGTYQILVGNSSRNLPLTGTITVPAAHHRQRHGLTHNVR